MLLVYTQTSQSPLETTGVSGIYDFNITELSILYHSSEFQSQITLKESMNANTE